MSISSGCQVHLKASALPQGPLLVKVSRHLTAVIDGVLYDTHNCSRGGTRCVYGYFSQPQHIREAPGGSSDISFHPKIPGNSHETIKAL